ncbi:hypothetical protein [Gudongella sp. DL1XJH-153]|uniref:hypothetical protein n=1 Tax=Gudongella sp. DL1XJH-153 TaxID=3409804 RepID=UPI003BB56DFF
MKVWSRGLAILLAGVLILGSGAAYAVSPNAIAKEKMNPGRMKAMEKIGNLMEVMTGIVDDVEVDIFSMENGNVGLIEGRIDINEKKYDFEDFMGNTKLKVKLNNVTVNIDSEGNFSQPMPMWKIEPLSVRVYMGKILVYSNVEDDLDEIRDEIDLERALDRAEAAIDKLPEDLDDLTIEDINLVERARIAVDILGEVVERDSDEEDIYESYLVIVEDAEDMIRDILEELIEWEIDLDETAVDSGMYYGKLLINRSISEELLVIVDFDDVDADDMELEIAPNGHVWFQTDETDFEVRVELDGVEIEELTVDFD